MTNNTNECITEGCTKEVRVKKRGLCSSHYQAWSNKNKPRAGKKPCAIEGCGGTVYARGWCQTHYGRFERWGDPLALWPNKIVRGTCEAPDCERVEHCRGMCKSHYMQWWFKNSKTGFDPRRGNVLEEVTYQAMHYRLKRTRGFAYEHNCVGCGEQATDWALRHDAKHKQRDQVSNNRMKGSWFSTDVNDYSPMCSDCHKAYDAKHNNRKGVGGRPKKVAA